MDHSQSDQLSENEGLIPAIVRSVTRSVSQRPASVLWLVALSVLLCLGVAGRFLSFKTARSDLIDRDSEFQQRWLAYVDAFGEESDVVVVVEADNPRLIREVLDDLGKQIEAEADLFDRVYWRFDPVVLSSKALQFLSPRQLDACLGWLDRHEEVLRGHWDSAGLKETAEQLARELNSSDPQLQRFAEQQAGQLAQSLQGALGREPFATPWLSEAPHTGATEPVYQINEQGTMGFLTAVPLERGNDFQGTSRSISRLRHLIAATRHRFEGVSIGLTGIPVLESDEMDRSQKDMTLASVISFVGVAVLLIVGFRGIRHPLMAMLMLLAGLAWSLGFATLVVGHLNILSVSFAAILIGLGIDFAIHYLAHYLDLRHRNAALLPALRRTSWEVGTGIVTAAVTTSLAFLCATLTDFLGVAELGVIAGGGILLCCVSTFVVLPAIIALADNLVESRKLPTPFRAQSLRELTASRPWLVTAGSLAGILLVGAGAMRIAGGKLESRVRYDANLLNLQADDVESVKVQRRVFEETSGSLLYAVSLSQGVSEARQRRREFERLPTVSRVEELATHMPQYTADETKLRVEGIRARLSHVSDFPRQFPRLNPKSIGMALEDLLRAVDARPTAAAQSTAHVLDGVLDTLSGQQLDDQVQFLENYQHAMLAALKAEFEAIAAVADPNPVSPADFPAALRERFVSADGQWLLRIFPAEQIWDEEPLARFVSDVRTVDLEATGTPLQNYEAARQIRDSYLKAAAYAFAVIWLVLLVDTIGRGPLLVGLVTPLALIGLAVITLAQPQTLLTPFQTLGLYLAMVTAIVLIFDFSNVRSALLTLMPPVGGGLLMFGILGLSGVDLNPANLIVLPLILGIGVDDGVHVIHDFRTQQGRDYRTSSSTINAIMLTSLTSMIGFGSMMLAAHRGLASLGLVLVIGVGSCLFVSLVTLPAILTLVSRRECAKELSAREEAIADDADVVPFQGRHDRAV